MGESAKAASAPQKSCCCHHKATPRSQQMQDDLQKRLNRVIGQLNGVKSMIDDNRYCGDVLTQLAAAESAVHSISAILLQNHLETCVVEQIEAGNTAIIESNDIRSITVCRMEVPCCGGLEMAARNALARSGKGIPLSVTTFSVRGDIL